MSDTRTAHGLTMNFFFQVTNMPELKKVKKKSYLNFSVKAGHRVGTKVPLWYQRSSTLEVEAGNHHFEAGPGYVRSPSFEKLKQIIPHSNQPTLYCQ